jgi:hypothetical protein
MREWDLNWDKNFQKKFQIFLPVKKELLLLHPLWETTKGGKNKEEYVPRHIELTAVSSERRDKEIRVR